ncbi:MAG TPA: phosphate ABC transporter permease PstA [Longimicrobiales bacterium]
MSRLTRRRFVNSGMQALTYLAAFLATLPLLLILGYLVYKGISSLSIDFFVHMPRPVGEPGGGMSNAIVGTLILIGMAALIGVPIGIGAGIYLAERKGAPLATAVRFLADVMNGMPSIVIGIFTWEFVVRPMGHFSALSGGIALGLMVIPTVTRTTEELIRTVPLTLREAALALGYARWRTSLRVVLPTALGGIVTGVLLAIARVAGETAPLLFTAFGNQFWSVRLNEPVAAVPLQVFNYAISPYEEWHQQAWAGALTLLALILVISLIARRATRGAFGHGGE